MITKRDFERMCLNSMSMRKEFAGALTYEELFNMLRQLSEEAEAEANSMKELKRLNSFILADGCIARAEAGGSVLVISENGYEQCWWVKLTETVRSFIRSEDGRTATISSTNIREKLPDAGGIRDIVATWIIDHEVDHPPTTL